jgi:pimeloyl-ACP methyl ester carboxylesterase
MQQLPALRTPRLTLRPFVMADAWDVQRLAADIDALPEPFPAPALIFAGRQDSRSGYHEAWQILENYPRATFAVLDRAGHAVVLEQRALFASLVSEWLDRVEEIWGSTSL